MSGFNEENRRRWNAVFGGRQDIIDIGFRYICGNIELPPV